jgi:hypothetical protein
MVEMGNRRRAINYRKYSAALRIKWQYFFNCVTSPQVTGFVHSLPEGEQTQKLS